DFDLATVLTQTANDQVETSTLGASAASWQAPVQLDNHDSGEPVPTSTWCAFPKVAVDVKGDAIAIWGGAALHASRRNAGSVEWQQPVVIAPGETCSVLALAIDPQGNAVTAWDAWRSEIHGLYATVLDTTPPLLNPTRIPGTTRAGHQTRFTVSATDLWS